MFQGLIQWLQGNVITALGTLAIIGAGITMLSMRFHLLATVAVCAGIWVMFNADMLLGLIRS